MLDLVDDRAFAQLREKAAGVRLGEVALVGRFQIGVLQVGEGRTAEGRLAGLAWPGHGDEGVLPEERRPRVDEGQGNRRTRLGQVVIDGLVDIAPRPLAKDDGFPGHLWPASRTRSQSRPK